ncbi:MAG: zf-HC2 domain-containing protein [Cyanobacteria bacterium SZAS TMP-1]|nr:zf-HC2 domain-containing protein [Cyanobacteria bacterium SZAS TMP-1]
MQDPNKLDCTQVTEMLDAFRDMELELAEAEMVEAHLQNCADCSRELEAIERVVASLKSLPEVPVKDFADAIEARILAQSNTAPAAESPTLSLVSDKDNVRSLHQSPRRVSCLMLVAAAVLVLCGVIGLNSFAPQKPAEVARLPETDKSNFATASHNLNTEEATAPLAEDVVALYDEDGGSNVSDVGISTNEDGLYAIKM